MVTIFVREKITNKRKHFIVGTETNVTVRQKKIYMHI